jgi:hypothetical protein
MIQCLKIEKNVTTNSDQYDRAAQSTDNDWRLQNARPTTLRTQKIKPGFQDQLIKSLPAECT